jgi:thiamine-phosphate pyrophosphorylase
LNFAVSSVPFKGRCFRVLSWSLVLFSDDLCLTPSAARILSRCCLSNKKQMLDELAGQLVVACLDEESLAGAILRDAGINRAMVQEAFTIPSMIRSNQVPQEFTQKIDPTTLPAPSIAFLNIAAGFAHQEIESNGISSEHLLAAVFEFESPMRSFLESHELSAESLIEALGKTQSAVSMPLPISVSFDLDESTESPPLQTKPHVTSVSPARVIDACMNRAREGLRVLEDYARFVTNNVTVVDRLKTLRHRLADSDRQIAMRSESISSSNNRLNARDVGADVGTQLTGDQELRRSSMDDIVHANARRVQESLRSLEEFGKLVSTEFALKMKQLRYDSYQIHQLMLADSNTQQAVTSARRQRLKNSQICVLLTESSCHLPWQDVVRSCLDGGADIIQLREKHLDDSQLLDRAFWITETCHAADALSIVNDRPDIALLSAADGVHLGQDDLSADQARRLLGPDYLIGLSTHNLDEIKTARTISADYLGVGPVYQSKTKDFDSWVGLELIHEASKCELPWFAIGGIEISNINAVTAAGGRAIAVSAAVIAGDSPDQAVAQLIHAMTV